MQIGWTGLSEFPADRQLPSAVSNPAWLEGAVIFFCFSFSCTLTCMRCSDQSYSQVLAWHSCHACYCWKKSIVNQYIVQYGRVFSELVLLWELMSWWVLKKAISNIIIVCCKAEKTQAVIVDISVTKVAQHFLPSGPVFHIVLIYFLMYNKVQSLTPWVKMLLLFIPI